MLQPPIPLKIRRIAVQVETNNPALQPRTVCKLAEQQCSKASINVECLSITSIKSHPKPFGLLAAPLLLVFLLLPFFRRLRQEGTQHRDLGVWHKCGNFADV